MLKHKFILTTAALAALAFAGCSTTAQKSESTSASVKKTDMKQVTPAQDQNMKKMANMPDYRFVSVDKATILQDGPEKHYCPICGMTLNNFYKTNHAASGSNGKDIQYCSIHCAVEDKEVNKNMLANFRAVDQDTLKFIDSQKAYFVVGSKMPGTMSGVSKYAFSSKESAEKFAAANGGKIMEFDAMYAMVKKGLAQEIKKVHAKQAKAAKKGGMLYKKMCKPTDKKFTSTANAKAYVESSKMCGNMKGKQLQMVGLYLGSR